MVRKCLFDVVYCDRVGAKACLPSVVNPDIGETVEQSRIGSWYFGTGQQLSGMVPFDSVERPIRDLHRLSREILHREYRQNAAGKQEAALSRIDSLVNQVVSLLHALHADDLRYRNDKEQSDKLLKERAVVRVNEAIAEHEADGPTGLRRRLLSTSVRLSRKMAPDIYTLSDECVERLSMDIPLELYVFASSQFNAMCFKPEEGRLFVMFSSALLEGFTPKELQFVMGHEFGHHVYDHHAIPIGQIVKGRTRPDPKLALRLFAWSRNAEISADRAGAYCAQDFH